MRLRTNGIAKKGKIRQKHACGEGWLNLEANQSHGINAGSKEAFNSLMKLPIRLEKPLIKGGVKIHLSRNAAKYFLK
jgi:hypothetical protein